MLYDEQTLFTLDDVLRSEFFNGDWYGQPFYTDSTIQLYALMVSMDSNTWDNFTTITGINTTELKTGILNKLWSYICTKYEYEFCIAVEGHYNSFDEAVSAHAGEYFYNFMKKIVYQMVATYPRYKKLLDSYAAEESKLMDQVKSYTKFNDTPQMANQYDSNEYVSTYTEYGNDIATKMARLDEIKRMYADLMNDWVDEFHNLFIE